MKTTDSELQRFNLYLLNGQEQGRRSGRLAALGLETKTLVSAAEVEQPALVVLASGERAPDGLAEIAIEQPDDAPASSVRELIRVAMENLALKRELSQLEEQAQRQHRQFKELNRIGIALSAERDITKLQEFILLTMRQLTHAEGASPWVTAGGH